MKKLIFCVHFILFLGIGISHSHPLGIFSVNRYTRIELAGDKIRLAYVMDVAEIPAIQEINRIDANRDGTMSAGECEDYAQEKIPQLQSLIHLTINSKELSLRVVSHGIEFPEGQGGLKTVRMNIKMLGRPLAEYSSAHSPILEDGVIG